VLVQHAFIIIDWWKWWRNIWKWQLVWYLRRSWLVKESISSLPLNKSAFLKLSAMAVTVQVSVLLNWNNHGFEKIFPYHEQSLHLEPDALAHVQHCGYDYPGHKWGSGVVLVHGPPRSPWKCKSSLFSKYFFIRSAENLWRSNPISVLSAKEVSTWAVLLYEDLID
jgi:hypothetical protein